MVPALGYGFRKSGGRRRCLVFGNPWPAEVYRARSSLAGAVDLGFAGWWPALFIGFRGLVAGGLLWISGHFGRRCAVGLVPYWPAVFVGLHVVGAGAESWTSRSVGRRYGMGFDGRWPAVFIGFRGLVAGGS
jgi:hypothetical protein